MVRMTAKAGEFQPSPRVSSILNIRTVVSSHGEAPRRSRSEWFGVRGHPTQIVVKKAFRACQPGAAIFEPSNYRRMGARIGGEAGQCAGATHCTLISAL